jgi:chromosome partitioning protein
MGSVICVANQKGGVGKTTTCVNLAASLAATQRRVLLIDLDPQANATMGCGIDKNALEYTVCDVLLDDIPVDDVLQTAPEGGFTVLPSNQDLTSAEVELVQKPDREFRLRKALEPIAARFDYVLIDCPPALDLLTINGLAAATEVLVPIQCEYYALEGLGQLMHNVQLVQRNLNPRLEVSTIVMVMFDARTKLAEQVVAEVREHFGDAVARVVVPRAVRLSEAPSFGQPITTFDPTSRGAVAYRDLALEVSGGPARPR